MIIVCSIGACEVPVFSLNLNHVTNVSSCQPICQVNYGRKRKFALSELYMWWFLSPIFFHFIARRHFIHANYRVCSWHLYHVNNSTLWHNDATLTENFERPSWLCFAKISPAPAITMQSTDIFIIAKIYHFLAAAFRGKQKYRETEKTIDFEISCLVSFLNYGLETVKEESKTFWALAGRNLYDYWNWNLRLLILECWHF